MPHIERISIWGGYVLRVARGVWARAQRSTRRHSTGDLEHIRWALQTSDQWPSFLTDAAILGVVADKLPLLTIDKESVYEYCQLLRAAGPGVTYDPMFGGRLYGEGLDRLALFSLKSEPIRALRAIDLLYPAGLGRMSVAPSPLMFSDAKSFLRGSSASSPVLLAQESDSSQLTKLFAQLADEWKTATEFESSITRIAMHPSYQRIIGMGAPAVPLILEDLARTHDAWFWALQAITGEDPVSVEDRGVIHRMVSAWVEWGTQKTITAGARS